MFFLFINLKNTCLNIIIRNKKCLIYSILKFSIKYNYLIEREKKT